MRQGRIRTVEDGLVEVELSGGRVYRGRPFGPQSWTLVLSAMPVPQEPKEEEVNEAGTKIYISLPPGDPRLEEYQHALLRYDQQLQEASWLNFFDGHLNVPDDWDIPRGHKRMGVTLAEDPDERLIQYIRLEVIRSSEDDFLLARAVRGEIEAADIEAAARLFQSDQEQQAAADGTQ